MAWLLRWFGVHRNDNRLKYSVEDNGCTQTMVDIIVSELRAAYATVSQLELQMQRSRLSLQTGGADYSWLMDRQDSNTKLPEIRRMEIEEICFQLRPEECNRLLILFKRRVENCSSGFVVLDVFKEIAETILKQRSRPVNLNDWFSSAGGGAHSFNKVSTICDKPMLAYRFEQQFSEEFSRPSSTSTATITSTGSVMDCGTFLTDVP